MERVLEPLGEARPPIAWAPFADARPAPPEVELSLLERGFRARPANPQLAAAYGRALLDRLEFDKALEPLSAAVAAAPQAALPRAKLAQCQVMRRDFDAALATLAFDAADAPAAVRAEVGYVRGYAHAGLGDSAAAEAELRGVLAMRPAHSPAFRKLSALLADAGRDEDLISLCDELGARGIRHSRLLSVRGRTLAALGRTTDAASLADMDRVECAPIGVPAGFTSLAAFNAALAENLIRHPYAARPNVDRAYSGGRVHHLLHGPRPELIRALADIVRPRMEAYVAQLSARSHSDVWAHAAPRKAHLDCWAIVQRDDESIGWHTHPRSWLTAVYYVAAPPTASAEGDGWGCLEFGPAPEAAAALADLVSVRRIAPEPGLLVLAPGHLHHRTIATGSTAPRVSVAFDLVADGAADASQAADA